MAKSEGEWKHRVLATAKASDTVIWKAQISTAPDGTEFAGIRKFAIKKDGTEQTTNAGLSFKYDGATIKEEVALVTDLLNKLTGGTVRVKTAAKKKPKAVATESEDEPAAADKWVVKTTEGKYLLFDKKRRGLTKKTEASTYVSKKAARAAAEACSEIVGEGFLLKKL